MYLICDLQIRMVKHEDIYLVSLSERSLPFYRDQAIQ